MKNKVSIMISLVSMLFLFVGSLTGCNTSNNNESITVSETTTEITQTELEVTEDVTASSTMYELSSSLVGLVDEESKPFNKKYNLYDFFIYEFKEPNINETFGVVTCSSPEYPTYDKEWKYLGEGVYYLQIISELEFFIYDDYLVDTEIDFSMCGQLSGNSKTGFELYEAFGNNFNKDGSYGWRKGDGEITTTGSYVMLNDNIMKLTRYPQNSDVLVEYYLVDNDNYMHRAYPCMK